MFELIVACIFFVTLIINIFGEYYHNLKIRYITKPALMPLLILFYYVGSPQVNLNWLIILALAFGTIGDIIMMNEKPKNYFLNGMMAFLIGQVFYIISFLIDIVKYGNFGDFPWWVLVLCVPGVLIGLFSMQKMKPKLGKMLIPTVIYSGSLLIMHFLTVIRSVIIVNEIFLLLYLGSLLFVISDTILAWNHFISKIEHYMVYVMSTYGLGQFFIAYSMLLFALLR
jgi:uncharacterized membrane protein YhhN